jgi:hypothetical protein
MQLANLHVSLVKAHGYLGGLSIVISSLFPSVGLVEFSDDALVALVFASEA